MPALEKLLVSVKEALVSLGGDTNSYFYNIFHNLKIEFEGFWGNSEGAVRLGMFFVVE